MYGNPVRLPTQEIENGVSGAQPAKARPASAEKNALKGGMLLFFLVLGVAIGKDILDIFSFIIDSVSMGLDGTLVGSLIGIPLMVTSEIADKAGALLEFLIISTYFSYIGGSIALRMVVVSIGSIIDAIPFADVLPIATFTFVVAFLLGRITKSGLGKVANVAKKVIKYA